MKTSDGAGEWSTLPTIEYFARRLRGITRFKHIVKSINIFPTIDEIFGKSYCRIYFRTEFVEESLKSLTIEEKKSLNNYFADNASVSGVEYSAFPVDLGYWKKKTLMTDMDKLKRLKSFCDCYESLTTFAIEFCDDILGREIPLRIQSLNTIADFAYIQEFWKRIAFTENYFEAEFGARYETTIYQHRALMCLSQEHHQHFLAHPERYLITDNQITESHCTTLETIRSIIIHRNIAVIVKGHYTIETVLIDIYDLKYKLKMPLAENEPSYLINNKKLDLLLNQVISETERITKKRNAVIKKIGLIKGDIALLKNGKVMEVLLVDASYEPMRYISCIMNVNLSKRKQSVTFYAHNIDKIIKQSDYANCLQKYKWTQREQLVRWAARKKCNIPTK